MGIILAAAGVLAMLVLTGCGGAEEARPHQSASLEGRAEAASKALSAGDWLEYYGFISPRSSALCQPEQFAIQMEKRMAELRGSAGIEEGEPLEWRVTRVTTSLAKGRVYHEILHNGQLIEFPEADEGARWVFLRLIETAESARIWWLEDENWEEGCPGLGSN